MRKKELKPLKLDSPEKFEGYLRVLWDELYWANFYYDIFKEAGRLCEQHKKVIHCRLAILTSYLQEVIEF